MSDDEQSYIVKPRDVGNIIRTADKDGLTELFERPVGAIVESITGWLAAGPKVWALATGRIVQGAFKGKLFQQVAAEISDLQAKGKIAEDFADRKYGFKTWVELFTVIDEEAPDEDRLEALKAMFYAANKVNATDGQQIVAYQLFQIAKKLNSNELLVMKAVYALFLKESQFRNTDFRDWAQAVAGRLGHSMIGLIEVADKPLVDNQLLTGRYGDLTAISSGNCRLTDLGLDFCKNIERYQSDIKS